MIFIDSNIPMYVVGSSHPRKLDALRLLEGAISEGHRLVTDAEVLQEILHRYSAIRLPAAIQPAFEVLLGIVDEVFPVKLADGLEEGATFDEIMASSERRLLATALDRAGGRHDRAARDAQAGRDGSRRAECLGGDRRLGNTRQRRADLA